MKLDLGESKGIEEFVNEFKSGFGNLDVLVNNAGIYINEFTPDSVERTFQTNFWGTKQLTESMLPLINKSGKVIFIASGMGCYNSNIHNKQLIYRFESGDDF